MLGQAGSLTKILGEKRANRWRGGVRTLRNDGVPTFLWEAALPYVQPFQSYFEDRRWRLRRRWYGPAGVPVRVQGSQMFLNPDDTGISKELGLYGVHEPWATRTLIGLLGEGMTVIDAGANIGYYALLESRRVGPRGRIIAIEPAPSNVEMLRKNLEANGCANVSILEVAIADRQGVTQMYLSGKSNWHSLFPVASHVGTVDVPVSTLDDIVESHGLDSVDLIRMDIEGYEVVALNGMRRTLEKYRPYVFVELHPGQAGTDTIRGFIDSLGGLGYRVGQVIDRMKDVPIRPCGLRVERMSLDKLKQDRRLDGPRRRPLLVFFDKERGLVTA